MKTGAALFTAGLGLHILLTIVRQVASFGSSLLAEAAGPEVINAIFTGLGIVGLVASAILAVGLGIVATDARATVPGAIGAAAYGIGIVCGALVFLDVPGRTAITVVWSLASASALGLAVAAVEMARGKGDRAIWGLIPAGVALVIWIGPIIGFEILNPENRLGVDFEDNFATIRAMFFLADIGQVMIYVLVGAVTMIPALTDPPATRP